MKYVGFASTRDSLKVVGENDLKKGVYKMKQMTVRRDYMYKFKTVVSTQEFLTYTSVTIIQAMGTTVLYLSIWIDTYLSFKV